MRSRAACVADHVIRHDESGSRAVIRAAYLDDMKGTHAPRPDIRVIVFDYDFGTDRALFHFIFRWTDAEGRIMTSAGMQAYHIDGSWLAETWIVMQPLGPTWTGTPQLSWTVRFGQEVQALPRPLRLSRR